MLRDELVQGGVPAQTQELGQNIALIFVKKEIFLDIDILDVINIFNRQTQIFLKLEKYVKYFCEARNILQPP